MLRGQGDLYDPTHNSFRTDLIPLVILHSAESITFRAQRETYVIGDSSSSAGPASALGQSCLCRLAPIYAGLIHHLHTSALYPQLTHV